MSRLAGPVAVGLLAGLLGLELLARWMWNDEWRGPSPVLGPGGHELPAVEGLFEMASANVLGVNRNVFYRTNGLGIRGPEYEPEPAPGVFRILVTGDSTTMGSGVLEEERYTNLVERRLDEADAERSYEIVNLGLSGLNTYYVVDRLEHLSRFYRSHLYVYGFSTNDIEGNAYHTRPGGLTPVEAGRRFWATVHELERSPSYLLRFLGARRLALGGLDYREEQLDNFLRNPEAWSEFLASLDRFAQVARRAGVCGHVLIHPDLQDLDESHPYLEVYDRIEQAAVGSGLGVSQGFPYLEGRDARSLWVSLFDAHPNREGHRLLAEALYDGLRRLPPECWKVRTTASLEGSR